MGSEGGRQQTPNAEEIPMFLHIIVGICKSQDELATIIVSLRTICEITRCPPSNASRLR